ncbi:hypothetical protein GCM10010313_70150 [Streptomyces violarus]|uniref:MFS transporter n=1 Tax=Streptomyces violarus TaxID=67380 RepID=A0A7W4ZYP0_9ACTN|nr:MULTISPECIES: hypothetical protein [Streptomyces]MBB3081013.1 hypothetical protein [Streptomyces violarus]WRU03800.1 hypothetical protein VJ737_36590 [Streptomyces sp. CGMCC 4.1772]GHD28912.1 hypothetical protein GCM10010313_70150 [Streptomyces violarus]
MSHPVAHHAKTGSPAPPRSNAVVGVLALAGIVVSLMQTLVIPIVRRQAAAAPAGPAEAPAEPAEISGARS